MHYGLRQISTPAALLTVDQAREHLRVSHNFDDLLIGDLIPAATRIAEQMIRRVFVTTSFELTLDAFPMESWNAHGSQSGDGWPPRFGNLSGSTRFPEAIVLPLAPLVDVTSVTYASDVTADDTPGGPAVVTLANVRKDITSQPPRIFPPYNKVWPGTARVPEAVKVTFTAGYGAAEAVPGDIVAAVKLILGNLYEHREDVVMGASPAQIPMGAAALLSPYKVFPL